MISRKLYSLIENIFTVISISNEPFYCVIVICIKNLKKWILYMKTD